MKSRLKTIRLKPAYALGISLGLAVILVIATLWFNWSDRTVVLIAAVEAVVCTVIVLPLMLARPRPYSGATREGTMVFSREAESVAGPIRSTLTLSNGGTRGSRRTQG